FWTGSGRRGELWEMLRSPGEVRREEWNHVVATFVPQGQQVEGSVRGAVHLYVNGEHVAEAAHELSTMDFEWPARIGAAEFVPRYLTSWLYKGFLRDVALYDHPLEPRN